MIRRKQRHDHANPSSFMILDFRILSFVIITFGTMFCKQLCFWLNFKNEKIYLDFWDVTTNLPKSESDKRKSDGDSEQPTWKKQDLGIAYIATIPSPTPLRQYVGDLPLYNECHYHHVGACRELVYNNCGRKVHTAKFCRRPTHASNQGDGFGGYRNSYLFSVYLMLFPYSYNSCKWSD